MTTLIQELADKMTIHLLTQQAKSTFQDRLSCAYRGAHGHKCAVGILISDEAYGVELEQLACEELPVREALEKSGIEMIPEVMVLLQSFQCIHDEYRPADWPTMLANYYNYNELTMPAELTAIINT